MTEDKSDFKKEILAVIMMGLLFVVIHGIALLLTSTFESAGMQAFDDTEDPMNIAFILTIMLVFTVLILVISRYWKKELIQVIILGAIGYTSFIVFYPLFDLLFPGNLWLLSLLPSIALAFIIVVALFKYPEWWVIDISGIVVGAGAIVIFGISLAIWLVIILLIILSIYDAISVYKTKHMIDLADTVMDLKLPVLLVVPKIRHYSLIKETKSLKEKIKEDEERDAFFMGLGDVVMPGILVIAIYNSINNSLPIVLSVIIGTLIGFTVLMAFVIKGKPQAGLPALCGGAILGYIISSYILYGEIVGLTIPL
jgi:presenilin-like A22 family membrane protease